ncbi:HAMP domain-containing histidine kinase [Cyanobium sp. FGCU-52]|nr:HAMP domain-containing histidine kinase [Cyanobium sp. FGCU52]
MASRLHSIRQRLLSSSLLAVLGGYALLLLAHSLFSSQERRVSHRALVAAVRQEVLPAAASPTPLPVLSDRLTRLVSPNLMMWVENDQGVPFRPPRHAGSFVMPQAYNLPRLLVRTSLQHGAEAGIAPVRAANRTYLISATPLQVRGRSLRLRLLEDVTDKVERERTISLLLALAAGISTLFTGLLLRPVLSRGLAPLRDLGSHMQAIGSESLERERLPVQGLPLELTPIAVEFNGLLERLSASWERQKDFVNGVSHELRTPITLIGSYAGRLRRRAPGLGAEERKQLLLIEEEAERMRRLVSDLLELARADARPLVLSAEPFDAGEALARVACRLAEASGGRLQIEPLPVAAIVLGDGQRYEQCVANLIENALKYAPGSAPIRLRLEACGDSLITHVIDAGPGVPPDERHGIFERFRRGRRTASIPGSGIGLAVVRTLMQAMGGEVSVADPPGGGADFRLSLRRAPRLPGA